MLSCCGSSLWQLVNYDFFPLFFVLQHVLERGKPQERTQIIKNLSGQVVKMSQHKFASNVIEKCLEYGNPDARELLIVEVIGQNDGNDNLLVSTFTTTTIMGLLMYFH